MSLTKWEPKVTAYKARYQDRGHDLRLEVDKSDIPGSNAWYWRVINEEGATVADGCRTGEDNFSGLGPAKSACTRAAKKYTRGIG